MHLDLPITNAYAAIHTGASGTVDSCAPATSAPQTRIIVGLEGAGAYHGQMYFDVSPLLYDTPIVSAKLEMYTPDQMTATGVQVFPNTSPASTIYQPLSWQQPSWDSAPRIVPGASSVS